jgi:hypothetical protein
VTGACLRGMDEHLRARQVAGSGFDSGPAPRFWEQTELYAAKRWRDVRFTEDEIRADPGLVVTRLRGPRTP